MLNYKVIQSRSSWRRRGLFSGLFLPSGSILTITVVKETVSVPVAGWKTACLFMALHLCCWSALKAPETPVELLQKKKKKQKSEELTVESESRNARSRLHLFFLRHQTIRSSRASRCCSGSESATQIHKVRHNRTNCSRERIRVNPHYSSRQLCSAAWLQLVLRELK